MTEQATGFIGRASAVEALVEEFVRPPDGLRVVLLSGEAGSGKSTLIAEAQRQAALHPSMPAFAVGPCAAVSRPYAPFRDALESLLPNEDEEIDSARVAAIRRLLLGAKELAPDVASMFLPGSGLVLAAGRFIAEEKGWFDRLRDRKVDDGVGLATRSTDDVEMQISRLFRTLSQERLVLVIEDAHWIDEASVGLLDRILADAYRTGASLTVLVSFRAEDLDAQKPDQRHPAALLLNELDRRYSTMTVDLNELGQLEASEFCAELAGSYPGASEELSQHLLEVTGGLPLFAVEYLALLREVKELERDSVTGVWRLVSQPDQRLRPASVRAVLRERLDRLDDDLLDLLEHCAIGGPDFEAQHVAALVGRDLMWTVKRLSRDLDRKHHLVADAVGLSDSTASSGPRYRFQHDLIREQLYEGLPGNYRRALHAELAEVLEQSSSGTPEQRVLVARHRERSGDPRRAVGALVEAARSILSSGNAVEAWDFIERANALIISHDLPADLVAQASLLRGTICYERRQYDRALESFERASALASELSDRDWSAAELGRGRSLWRTKRSTDARLALHRVLSSSRAADAHEERLEATRHLGILLRNSGDPEGALALYYEVREQAQQAEAWPTLASVCNSIGFLRGTVWGQYDEALRYYQEAADITRDRGLHRDRILYLRNLHRYGVLGQHDLARERVAEAIDLADQVGNPNDQFRSRLNAARIEIEAGAPADGLDLLDAIANERSEELELDKESNYKYFAFRALAALLTDDLEAASAATEQALATTNPSPLDELGTVGFIRALCALRKPDGERDLSSCHSAMLAEVEGIRPLVGSENPSWYLLFNLALAFSGAAATAPDAAQSRGYAQQAIEALGRAPSLAGAFDLFGVLLDEVRFDDPDVRLRIEAAVEECRRRN